MSDERFSTGAAGVHVTGRADALTELTLAARDTNAWYRLWVDSAFRLRREEIVGAGLLARRTFRYPSRSSRIVAVSPCPPNSSASQIAATVGAIWRVPSSVTRW